jgi:hypothetical protein
MVPVFEVRMKPGRGMPWYDFDRFITEKPCWMKREQWKADVRIRKRWWNEQ